MRRRLDRDGLGEVAGEVVAWLGRLGYLDDAAYARARARSLLAPGRLGPRLAERRLLAAGIPPAEARAAVAAALCEAAPGGEGAGRPGAPAPSLEVAEAALARALAEKRAAGVPLDALEVKGQARLARFLLGRGFSGRAVSRALGIYLDQD